MIIHSTRLGQLEVGEEEFLTFGHGLPGFPEQRRFVLLPYEQGSPFAFLQSATEPDLTFLLVDPFSFFADYQFELDDNSAVELGLDADNLPEVWSIVSVPATPRDMTANLLAPIVINRQARLACQSILQDNQYATRHRMFPVEGGD